VPDDAVVPLADDELEGALLSRVTVAPASRAKLGSAAHDEGAEPQDLSFDSAKVSSLSGLSNLLWKFSPIHFCGKVTPYVPYRRLRPAISAP
jgi:hypothetical protein